MVAKAYVPDAGEPEDSGARVLRIGHRREVFR
jgi:hypothetical protein